MIPLLEQRTSSQTISFTTERFAQSAYRCVRGINFDAVNAVGQIVMSFREPDEWVPPYRSGTHRMKISQELYEAFMESSYSTRASALFNMGWENRKRFSTFPWRKR